MLQTLRRNLRWTLAYNFGAVPLAALGFVPPWLAALGMSASSLLVIVNSFAIGTERHAEGTTLHDPRALAVSTAGVP